MASAAAVARTALLTDAMHSMRMIAELNPRLNAVIAARSEQEVIEDVGEATETLFAATAPEDAAKMLPLQGRLLGLKDTFSTTWGYTTCCSNMLRNYKAPYNATVVDKLSSAGAVFIGKTNMDEFAMGTDNIHSIFGPPLNPLYPKPHSTGGSSGGSAAAVASGMCYAALGTDTGGSVRLPAAYCGVVGFKPSYGLISRWGVIAFAQSLDTVGVFARDVGAVRDVFHAITDYDNKDPTSISPPLRKRIADATEAARNTRKKYKIGVPYEFMVDRLSPVVRAAWKEVLLKLRAQGHILQFVSLPAMRSALPTYYILAPAEASSNLARYDGVRFGFRGEADRDQDCEDGAPGVLYGETRSRGFGVEVRRRILLGNYNLSSGAMGNHYIQAQKVRRIIQQDFNSIFALENPLPDLRTPSSTEHPADQVDFLVSPCSTSTAPSLADIYAQKSPLDAYVNDVLTVPASLAGIPAISVPWKLDGEASVVGIQIMAQYGDDERLLDAAEQIMNLQQHAQT
ncbi:amidase signature domain-containing protein [Limtongia smithiae]|uniref:amidase signature domain-containing protein n=1 Tax=Limtongia smithiae TaxID=1125753 RepID=UPI0034CD528C